MSEILTVRLALTKGDSQIAISVVVLLAVVAAAVMHAKWFGELQRMVRENSYDGLTFGSAPDWPAKVARWFPVAIPVFFIIAWVCMLGFVLIMFVQSGGG
jgi:hypothetical protein